LCDGEDEAFLAPAPDQGHLRERFSSLKGLWGVVLLFGAVLGGISLRFFSVNQSAANGAFLAILLTLVNRRLNWHTFKAAMRDTVTTSP
jgi:TRAP-type mannitol/chloroaromatic compound transport system permease large subunit